MARGERLRGARTLAPARARARRAVAPEPADAKSDPGRSGGDRRGRRGVVRRVLAVRRSRTARGHARDAARPHASRRRARTSSSATGCSAAAGATGYVQRLAVGPDGEGQRPGTRCCCTTACAGSRCTARPAHSSTPKRTTRARSSCTSAPGSHGFRSACACWDATCESPRYGSLVATAVLVAMVARAGLGRARQTPAGAAREGRAGRRAPRVPGQRGSRSGRRSRCCSGSTTGRSSPARARRSLIQIHESMATRTSFDNVIANGDAGGGLYTLTVPVASLPRLGGQARRDDRVGGLGRDADDRDPPSTACTPSRSR